MKLLLVFLLCAGAAVAAEVQTNDVPCKPHRNKHHHHHVDCHCGRPAPLADTCAGYWGDIIFVDSAVGEFPIAQGDFSSGHLGDPGAALGGGGGGYAGNETNAPIRPPVTNNTFWTDYQKSIINKDESSIGECEAEYRHDNRTQCPETKIFSVPEGDPFWALLPTLCGLLGFHWSRSRK